LNDAFAAGVHVQLVAQVVEAPLLPSSGDSNEKLRTVIGTGEANASPASAAIPERVSAVVTANLINLMGLTIPFQDASARRDEPPTYIQRASNMPKFVI
jgi:hypothetical protein